MIQYSAFKLQAYLVTTEPEHRTILLQMIEIPIKETNSMYYMATPIRYLGDTQSKEEYYGEGNSIDDAIQHCLSKIGNVERKEFFQQDIQVLSPEQITSLKKVLASIQ
jgi:hypothetical protein